jgi:tetratricopeptide (TPR) repeat protein
MAVDDLRRFDEAFAAYERALALDPRYARAWKNKGIDLRSAGRETEAQETRRRARELGV